MRHHLSDFENNGKNEFRVFIKHYYSRVKTAKEAKEKFGKYYGTSDPSNITVKRWINKFKFGHTTRNDKPNSERPSDAITLKIIKQILRLVTDDRKLKVREISKMIIIST